MRLFFSLDPTPELQAKIADLRPIFKNVRLMPKDQLHLTLLFLGDQSSQILHEMPEALESLIFGPLTIELSEIGHFRSGVIWLGIKPNPKLFRLQKQLSNALQRYGVKFQHRRYTPHLTLARTKQLKPSQLTTILNQYNQAFSEHPLSFNTHCIFLKSSQLTNKGAIHRIEAEWQV